MKIPFLILFLFTSCIRSTAQDFQKHILFLASDSLHGRAPGTEDELKAAYYIKQELSSSCSFITLQHFTFNSDSAINVIGFLDFRKDSTIIISAHYDHLGYGSGKSNEILKKGIHPGADDNASGVSLMMALAKEISKTKNWPYNFVFAGISAHEAGLFGAAYFSKSALCSVLKIRAVVNFDMVGRLDKTNPVLRISGIKTDESFITFFSSITGNAIHIRPDDSNISDSDLQPFAVMKIPVLNITTGIHSDYHKLSDTQDKINYDGMKAIFSLMKSFLQALK